MNKVSILIPCRNEENYIGKCIESLINLHRDDFDIEIVIVDGRSVDKTRTVINEWMQRFDFIRLVDNPEKRTPMALNLGIRNALGNFILIGSAHSSFSKDYLSILMKERERLDADVVGGVMTTSVLNSNKKSEAVKEVLSCRFGVGNAYFRTGVSDIRQVDTVPFGLYKRSLFEEAGYYDERLIRNHDMELSKRLIAADKKIFLIPAAKCSYYARENYSALAGNNYRNGLWSILTVKIIGKFSALSLRHFIPLLFLLSLILPPLAAVFYFPFLYLSFLSLFLYLCFLIVITGHLARIKKLSFLHLLGAFIVLHLSYSIGSLCGIFKSVKND